MKERTSEDDHCTSDRDTNGKMKYEETSDITTLLLEPDDHATAIADWVNIQHKAVIIIVPENVSSVFQRPGDFRELKQVMTEREKSLMLVMPGNERLRQWARRQGFLVFSSTEICEKMLAQYGLPQIAEQAQAHKSHITRTTDALARQHVTTLKLQTALARRASRRITEPLTSHYQQTDTRDQFVDTSDGSAAYEWHGKDAYPTFTQSSTDTLRLTQLSPQGVAISRMLVSLKDKTLLILLALLALGVVGGIGFGYLLSLFPIAMH